MSGALIYSLSVYVILVFTFTSKQCKVLLQVEVGCLLLIVLILIRFHLGSGQGVVNDGDLEVGAADTAWTWQFRHLGGSLADANISQVEVSMLINNQLRPP